MGGLSFLYPAFLVGLAALAIPIAVHLFRRRTEVVVDFPAVRLLQKAPVEQQRRRRLRELLLLALRLGAVALVALAFARPYFHDAAAAVPSPVTVVAIDASLSMSAPGQIDRARDAARRAVEQAPATHQVALVAFSDDARIVVAPTTDRGGVLSALASVTPTFGGTRYRTALARAAESIASGQGAIVVVTDLQQVGWDAEDEGAVPDGVEVNVVEIAAPLGNLAVTSLRRDGQRLVAACHNFAARPVKVMARLQVNGKDVRSMPLQIGANAAIEATFDVVVPDRGVAAVVVDDAGGYLGDNTRYLALEPEPATPVYVVTSASPESSDAGLYVERALSLARGGRAFDVRTVDGVRFSALPAAEVSSAGAIVLLGTSTLDRGGRERVATFLREGGRMLLTLGPDTDAATLADTVGVRLSIAPAPSTPATGSGSVTLVAVDSRHPIFRPFSSPTGALGDVQVERFWRLTDRGDGAVLATFSGVGEALVEYGVGRGRLLVFASDLNNVWNRFPLNVAFVPWAVETAHYLVQGREVRHTFTLPELPAGIPATPGVHLREGRPITVNTDIKESNPARTAPDSFASNPRRVGAPTPARAATEARAQEERQRLWQIGLLAVLAALVTETVLGRRP